MPLLSEQWNLDVLEASGKDKLLSVINKITAGFAWKKYCKKRSHLILTVLFTVLSPPLQI
jgi:hypothetical protein